MFILLLSGLFCCLGFSGVFFLLFGRLLFGRGPRPRPNTLGRGGGVLIFLLFGQGACFFFAVWAWGVFLFLLFGLGRVLFLLFRRGRVLFVAIWAGGVFFLLFVQGTGVHSLTRLPGLSLSDPTTKETEQQKKKHGFRVISMGP